jgi:hypothetical protein
MASIYSCTTEGEEALAAATAETVLAVLGDAVVRGKIVEWGVSFDGVSSTAEPVRCRIVQITTDGTATNATAKIWTNGAPAANCQPRKDYSAEPTKDANPYVDFNIHPQTGFAIQYPLGRELELPADGTDGFGIELTAAATVNATAYIVWEE